MNQCFVEEQGLLEDSYRLAVTIFASGYRPDFIVGLWRGGSTVGIYVQECLQYLGVSTDHIAVRSSYQGRQDYLRRMSQGTEIQVHGLQYLYETLEAHHSLLVVDDVFSSGNTIAALIERLRSKSRKNMPAVKVAALYYRPTQDSSARQPDYYLHETGDWMVLPYEITDISRQDMQQNKAWLMPLLDRLKPGWS